MQAKFTRYPFSSSEATAKAPLDEVVMDVVGPLKLGAAGAEYFLTIVDGVDYFLTFSPTPKMTILRVLLHVAAQRDYELHSLDFSIAFLHGSLHEEIWLRPPPGFTGTFPAGSQWSLCPPVYDLRHAPREWHDTLRTALAALGFAPSTADPSLFLCTDTLLPPFYVLVYVKNLVFAFADTEALTLVKSKLQKRHTCTDLVRQAWGSCLGDGVLLSSWVDDSATQRSSQGYTFSLGSGSLSWRSTRSSSVLSSSCEAEIYASAMASQEIRWLTYLLNRLGRAASFASSFRGQLRLAHVATRANTDDVFTKALPSACFALLLLLTEDLTSVGGFICCVGGGPTAWESKKQVDQALSLVKSEYMALFRAVREIVWQRRLLAELGEEQQGPTPLYCDSQGAIALAKNPVLHGLSKHMRVMWHWTRSMVAAGEVDLRYVKTTGEPADMMTKRLVEQQHWK
ncbi:unnamed protein product [Closterium sp. NIES-53]